MELVINPQDRLPLVIGATGMDAIVQNIRMILLTMRYSIPLDRAFAHDGKIIDTPAPLETGRKTAELVDAIEKYEPRVKVHRIDFVWNNQKGQLQEGQLAPAVVFSIRDGVEL